MKRILFTLMLVLASCSAAVTAQEATLSSDGKLTVTGTNRSEVIQINTKRYGTRKSIYKVEVKITDDIGRVYTADFYEFRVDEVEVFALDGHDDIIYECNIPSVLRGGKGDDDIFGGPADDILKGDEGADHLMGGPGSDELHAGPGSNYFFFDLLEGEEGLDEFYYNYYDYVFDPTYNDDSVYLDGSPCGPWPFILAKPDLILGNGTMYISEF